MNSHDQLFRTAEYWHSLPEGGVQCELCPHHCHIREGNSGRCRVRSVVGGELKAMGYGMLSSVHVDPVEKKPLYHYYPGSMIFSAGGWGCNFACVFCQNWTISQDFRKSTKTCSPSDLVATMRAEDCSRIAYTYNEPLVGFEFVRDCCRLVKDTGGSNVLVTNGYCEVEPARELLPLIEALNVDIKSMDEEFYRAHCKGTLAPVLRFCQQARAAGCHLEITNLIIPGLNDSDAGIEKLALWIRDELGPSTPLHLSAYHPDYRLNNPPTSRDTLLHAHDLCRRHLNYVYMGNLPVRKGQDTACPGCGETMVERVGYETRIAKLVNGACSACGRQAELIV